ncbi:HNH endonuclease [Salmonella enterica]|nr:HNH endonuclease [Salmonella enterica]
MAGFRKDPPPDELRDRIFYKDGELYWHEAYYTKHNARTERPIGSLNNRGYKRARLDVDGVPRDYLIHRLIWWLETGDWVMLIDHKDRNKLNNRIENLRSATILENNRNTGIGKNNKSGYLGVVKNRDKYVAYITLNQKHYYSHGYENPQSAAVARDILANLFYGESAVYNLIDNENLEIMKPANCPNINQILESMK